jgi:hypothetical protein
MGAGVTPPLGVAEAFMPCEARITPAPAASTQGAFDVFLRDAICNLDHGLEREIVQEPLFEMAVPGSDQGWGL